jgi:hypothetical protein
MADTFFLDATLERASEPSRACVRGHPADFTRGVQSVIELAVKSRDGWSIAPTVGLGTARVGSLLALPAASGFHSGRRTRIISLTATTLPASSGDDS